MKINIIISIIAIYVCTVIVLSMCKKYFNLTDYLEGKNGEKYIMYSCDCEDRLVPGVTDCGGWGDRLKGIMSAYWWSTLSGRKLLLKINKPCNLSNLLQPNKINWFTKLTKKTIKKYSKVTLFKINDDNFKKKLQYIDVTKYHRRKKFIILKTNRNFVWSFANTQIPIIQSNILKLGYNNTKEIDIPFTFHNVNSKLFKLAPKLDIYLRQFYTQLKPNKDTTLICVHIRTYFFDSFQQQSPIDRIKIWNFVQTDLISQIKDDNYNIFISADNYTIRNEAIQIFGSNKIIYNKGDNIIHIDYVNTSNECTDEVEQIFKDFYTFQYCDMAILSSSQFSRFGIWNKGEVPRLLFLYNGFNFTRITNYYKDIVI